MTEKRKNEIIKEATKRLNTWIFYKSFKEMTNDYSFNEFKKSLCLSPDYTFRPYWWTIDFNTFVSVEETFSVKYNKILKDIFDEQMQRFICKNNVIEQKNNDLF